MASFSGARAESVAPLSDTQVSLGSRVFELEDSSPKLAQQTKDHFVSLTSVEWIDDLTESSPDLAHTVIHITDRGYGPGTPTWRPNDKSRYYHDPTLPPFFDQNKFEVGWISNSQIKVHVRGDLLIFPKHDPQNFFALCAYDRSDPRPSFCSVNLRHEPDQNLFVKVRIYGVTLPLNDFTEIAAQARALVRCLDVTDSVRAGRSTQNRPHILLEDILPGGRCRLSPIS